MEIFFAYLAGLLTLINPCVLPVLPIVFGSALQENRLGPVALAMGMTATFVIAGMGISVFGRAIGLDESTLVTVGATMMIGFGLILMVPQFSRGFASATGGLAGQADAQIDRLDSKSLWGQFLGGALLGLVWVPCVGPTLGGAIALASTGESLGWAALIMLSFGLGISTLIIGLAYGAQTVFRTHRARFLSVAQRARPIMGAVFLFTGLALLTGLFKQAEIWLLDTLPFWLQDLSVRF